MLIAIASPYSLAALYVLFEAQGYKYFTFSTRVMLDLNSSSLDLVDQYGFSLSCPFATSWTSLEFCESTIASEMEHCLCFSMSLGYYQLVPR